MRLVDRFLPHLHPGLAVDKSEGIKTSWQRSTLLVLAITLHNIPEAWLLVSPLVPSPLTCRQRPLVVPSPWPSVSVFRIFRKAQPFQCRSGAKE